MIHTKSHQALSSGAEQVKKTPILSLLKEPSREDALYIKALGTLQFFFYNKNHL
jgi:hypothetical protein